MYRYFLGISKSSNNVWFSVYSTTTNTRSWSGWIDTTEFSLSCKHTDDTIFSDIAEYLNKPLVWVIELSSLDVYLELTKEQIHLLVQEQYPHLFI